MATADELLSGASADNKTLVIDNDLRTIIIPSGVKVLGVASDDEVLRLKFKMPRYVSDTDLSTFSIRINYYNASNKGDLYTVSDAVVGSDYITFTWLVGPVATKVKGTTKFNVCAIKLDSNGNIAKEFNTTIATLNVLEGLEAETKAVTLYSDVIEQWRSELFGIGDTEESNIIAVSNEQQDVIANKGAEVLATIPEDYTYTYNRAEESVRTKADAIVCSTQGESVMVNDSSDDNLRNLRVFGKTTQFSTTGKNLLNVTMTSETKNGVTATVNTDGSISLSGTPSGQTEFNVGYIVLPVGTYIMNGCPINGSSNTHGLYTAVGGSSKWDLGSGVSFSVTEESRGWIAIRIGSGAPVNGLTFYPMISVEGGAYEPYTGGVPVPNPDAPQDLISIENPTATIYGKNILEFKHEYNLLPENVTMIEELENGAILQGAEGVVPGGSTYSSGWYQVRYNNRIPLKAGQTVTLSFDYTVLENPYEATAKVSVHFSAKNSYSLNDGVVRPSDGVTARLSRTVTIEKDDEYFFTIGLNSCKVRVENIQLEFGDKPTAYEPYKPAQPITIPHTLPGVPVIKDGNYTDANGQQWICDEVDFERGVYVQRVIKKTFSASVNEAWRVYNVHSEKTHTAYQESKLCSDMKVPVGTAADIAELISNKFAAVSLTSVYNDGTQGISVSNVSPAIRMCVDVCQGYSVDDFKAWLKENPFELMYPLATPIEIPLTQDEIEAFKAMHSNYPNTTVVNDANAWMELQYNADTKTWVSNYLADKATMKSTSLALYANKWTETDSGYSQVVSINGVTSNSKIDLQPSPDQLASLVEDGTSLTTGNDNGTVTVYAIGAHPDTDMTIQVLITEVVTV